MNTDTECRNCKFEFNFDDTPDGSCPKCKSNKINRRLFVSDEIQTHETLKMGKHDKKFAKNKNPRQYIMTGEDFSVKKNKWVKKNVLIDKDNNLYKESIVDSETGEIIHYCEEPLTQHIGHGSAKKMSFFKKLVFKTHKSIGFKKKKVQNKTL